MKKQHYQAFTRVEFHQDSTKAWVSHFTTGIDSSEIENNKPVFDAIDAFMGEEESSVTLPDSLEFDSSDYWQAVLKAHNEILVRLYRYIIKQLAPIAPDGHRWSIEDGEDYRVYTADNPHDVQEVYIRTIQCFKPGK